MLPSTRPELVRQLKGRTAVKRETIPPIWQIIPRTFDPGRIQPITPYQLNPLRGYVLRQLSEKIEGIDHMQVFLEVVGIVSMEQHPPFKRLIGYFF